MIETVGIMFFSNGKLLLKKQNQKYELIGSEIRNNENYLETTVRAIHESLGEKVIVNPEKIEYLMSFESEQKHINIFKYNGLLLGKIDRKLKDFMWYGIDTDYNLLSIPLQSEVIPYCLNSGLIKMVDFNKIKNDELTEQEKYIKDITELNVKLKVKKGVYHEFL